MSRSVVLFLLFALMAVLLFVGHLVTGYASVAWTEVMGGGDEVMSAVAELRLVKAVVALVAGAALSVSGLQMQTLFRNPLAGPYVLGISSGASLGVALFILSPLSLAGTLLSGFGVAGAAWIGSAAVLAIIAVAGQRVKNIMAILILGMMMSSGVSAVVQILQYLSSEESLKSFVVWTMGSLGEVTTTELWVLMGACAVGFLLAVLAIKPLNLLLMGEEYARTMGLNVRRSHALLFASTTLLAGTVTAFCGPIGFIGLAVPHVTRLLWGQSNHRTLVPATMLTGAVALLACDLISKTLTLPVNAITSLLGIPVVVWIVLKVKN